VTQQAQQPHQNAPQQAVPQGGDWFWRILAFLMLLMLCWMGWVFYQLSPRQIATPAAYDALAQARAAGNLQEGHIRPAVPPVPAAPAAPRKPPVDVDKLRLSDSIETPIPQK
jgi:hypothetical protein